jgi:hypothetical protein
VEPNCQHRGAACIVGARLFRPAFDVNLENSPGCGGGMNIISGIVETAVIERDFERYRLPTRGQSAAHGPEDPSV